MIYQNTINITLKNKNNDSVISAFENIITSSTKPTVIISDSDSTFLSKKFQQLLEQYDIIHNTVPVGDHNSLGVIDRFALTLKRILSKQREITKSANWVDSIDKIISIYKNTEHSALNNLSPNQAGQTKYKQEIQKLNIDKAQSNKIQSDLLEGDRVRILDKKLFKKGSEPQYTIKMRDMLLKVHKDTIPTTNNKTITQKITNEKTIERKLKSDGVDEKNIVTTKRRR